MYDSLKLLASKGASPLRMTGPILGWVQYCWNLAAVPAYFCCFLSVNTRVNIPVSLSGRMSALTPTEHRTVKYKM